MSTIIDVARVAGVSVATVSNYLNHTKPVKRVTADRISAAIEEMNYIPNQMAKVLKSNVSKNIGIILPNIQDNYYAHIFQGIEKYMYESGYVVNLCLSHDLAEIEQRYIIDLLGQKICGLIMVTAQPENTEFFMTQVVSRNIPLIQIDRKVEKLNGFDMSFVCFDNKRTLQKLSQYYESMGKKNITLFCGPSNFSCEREAEEGFKESCVNGGDENNSVRTGNTSGKQIVHTALNKESAFRAAVLHLNSRRPDAIITTSALVTEGILESIALMNLKVPEDIAIATLGVDNWNKQSDWSNIITTSREAIFAGREAARLLLRQIEQPGVYDPRTLVIEDKFSEPTRLENGKEKIGSLKAIMLDTLQVSLFGGLVTRFEILEKAKINITKIQHQDMLEAIYRDNRSTEDEGSDIIMYDLPWLYKLVQDNVLADITEEIKDEEFSKDIYLKNCLSVFGEFNGRFYGLPYMYAPQILFYRNDIFNDKTIKAAFYKQHKIPLRPPRTWKEFNTVARFFTQSLNPESPVMYGTAVPIAYAECLAPEVYMRLWGYGGEVFNKRNDVTFNSEETMRAYNNFIEAVSLDLDYNRGLNDMDVVDEFLSGKLAMLITYPPFVSNINELHRNCRTGQIGFAAIPGKCPILGGWGLGVSAKSKNKKNAFRFIQWACGKDMANYFTIMAGQAAITKVFDNNELVSLYPWLPLYKETYDLAVPLRPPVREGHVLVPQDVIDGIIADNVYKLLNNQASVEETVGNTEYDLKNALIR